MGAGQLDTDKMDSTAGRRKLERISMEFLLWCSGSSAVSAMNYDRYSGTRTEELLIDSMSLYLPRELRWFYLVNCSFRLFLALQSDVDGLKIEIRGKPQSLI